MVIFKNPILKTRPRSHVACFATTGVLLVLASWAPAAAAERPNIVLIVADDLGWGDLGCYGSREVHSPAIDGLARDGVRLTEFYANAPECTPTRTALLTGRYQHRVGGLECAIGVDNVGRYDDAIRLANRHDLGLPAEEKTLARRLKTAGYATGLFGKWHLGYEKKFLPRNHGFDHAFGCLGGNMDYFRHREANGRNVLFENGELIERDGYMTALITEAAVEFLERCHDERFFLYVPYTAPHTPVQVPGGDTGELIDEDNWNRGSRADYVTMIEAMDAGTGRILGSLDECGLRDDTLVVFMSDNGAMRLGSNGPFRGYKSGLFEGGIRVPCVIRWPGRLPAGVVDDRAAISMDLTYSLVRIAGATPPADRPFDGIDLIGDLERGREPRRRTLFWRQRRGELTWRAVRDGTLKRIWRHRGEELEEYLFDLAADPGEEQNLLAERPEAALRLERLMRAWEREVAPRR